MLHLFHSSHVLTRRDPCRSTFRIALLLVIVTSCSSRTNETNWDFEIDFGDNTRTGVMQVKRSPAMTSVTLNSYDWATMELTEVKVQDNEISGAYDWFTFTGAFQDDQFSGTLKTKDEQYRMTARRQSDEPKVIDRSEVPYLLSTADLPPEELDIDHAGIIKSWDRKAFVRGQRIYNANCINCHGTPEVDGSIPQSRKFWANPFKAGSDPYSMYLTLTRGYGAMPPQLTLTPQEKYDVVLYLQEAFLKKMNDEAYVNATPGYLRGLPQGSEKGPATQAYHPWSDMDYGNFFINTYELVDSASGPERYHSPRPVPYEDENYLANNFAYKGIAVRLDEGEGGVSKGNTWMIFDHDLMRVAGGWTGEGFIDWNAILLNDKHETYPRTVGKLHFETPVGPGWANPQTGSFEDPRFRARDGRAFGPLPKEWADYKGLYHSEDRIIISYTVGDAEVLEELGRELIGQAHHTAFTRTLEVGPSSQPLKMRIAPSSSEVAMIGEGAVLSEENGFHVMTVNARASALVRIYITDGEVDRLDEWAASAQAPGALKRFTNGGPAHYPEVLTSEIIRGTEEGPFAIDKLLPPFDNPWNSRMKLSGIDFMADPNRAVACSTDGDIWLITGLTSGKNTLQWRKIGAGLFQPLGIKVLDEKIFIACRDQIVLLRDYNNDMETDFYESFNHDHQVSDHFHEFAMGLQADREGNLYYAKSGRHAREALIPQHGTLLKVSRDGSNTEVVATGFRAANGVCINPDGGFIVTDQQGYWNPMNRINWIDTKGKFYGNMWGYDPPQDTSRAAMEPPMVWVDMEFDRSPSELAWVDSEQWGPMDGGLLSFSYGFGKIQWVLHEEVNGQKQGGVIDLPGIKFLTGVMRGRFNPQDGHLYACGMSAWGTTQMMRGGGLYRVRYTGEPITVPLHLNALETGIEMEFASALSDAALETDRYEVNTWELKRSSKYGSDRYNKKELEVTRVRLLSKGKRVKLYIAGIKPVDVMTISYDLEDQDGNPVKGKLQNTIHHLGNELNL
ncbi:MAG: DUF6797 domain-containing protein [Bacteroidota bacterium]